MTRIKTWDWHGAPAPQRLPRRIRTLCAWVLAAASVALDRLAQRLAEPDAIAVPSGRHQIEFHAMSGAPEGALYVDGKLVGWLEDVRRL